MWRRFPICLVLVLLTPLPARAVDPFYEGLLRDGILADERGDAARAEKLLRLACFGLLEEPPVLARCRVRLALVQARLQDEAALRATCDRILVLEQRFAAYSQAELGAAERRLFESRLGELASPEALARVAAFRHLVRPPEEPPAGEGTRASAGEQAASPAAEEAATAAEAAPPEVEKAAAAGPAPPGTEEPAAADEAAPPEVEEEAAEAAPPGAQEAAATAADPPEDLAAAIARAHGVRTAGTREETRRELERLRPLAERHPEIRELQHLAAELAYRLRLWPESRSYFERGGDVDSDRPAVLFYYAVVLYETGAPEAAAEVLERSLPRLRRTPFVDEYVEKILGADGSPGDEP